MTSSWAHTDPVMDWTPPLTPMQVPPGPGDVPGLPLPATLAEARSAVSAAMADPRATVVTVTSADLADPAALDGMRRALDGVAVTLTGE